MTEPEEPLDHDEPDPTSGTDLGLGPEPEPTAEPEEPDTPASPPGGGDDPPFRVGTLGPAVPASPPVVAPGDEPRSSATAFAARRTWAQRALLVVNCLVITACFVGAGALVVGRHYANRIQKVDITQTAAEAPVTGSTMTAGTVAPGTTVAGAPLPTVPGSTVVGDTGAAPTEGSTVPPETFPPADPTAKNFLITGADNNACLDPDSPYAAAFGDREALGERSDTVMIMRVDPANRRAAILSFPRDLWVQIAGRNSKNRINSAYVRDDPNRLIQTILLNFSIGIDHFIQVDFCAFKRLVDAVGGVTVPFEYATRDTHTGLNVPEPGCFTFDGDHALAYVRSRYYQYYEDEKWKSDPVSDLGRISRQQDFIRRALSAALDKGVYNPSVARGLIDIATQSIVVDTNLTINKMLELVGVLRDFDPGTIRTYQIEAEPQNIAGNSVLIPRIKGENMQAILHIFQGIAPLAGAPEQVFETTTTSTDPDDPTTTTAPGAPTVPPTTAAPVDEGPEENVKGIVPPDDMEC